MKTLTRLLIFAALLATIVALVPAASVAGTGTERGPITTCDENMSTLNAYSEDCLSIMDVDDMAGNGFFCNFPAQQVQVTYRVDIDDNSDKIRLHDRWFWAFQGSNAVAFKNATASIWTKTGGWHSRGWLKTGVGWVDKATVYGNANALSAAPLGQDIVVNEWRQRVLLDCVPNAL